MTTPPWRDPAFLDGLRGVGDPDADAVVSSLFENEQIAAANAVLAGLTWDGEVVPSELPPALARFLLTERALPGWADPTLIARGQRLFVRHGLTALMGLLFRSLPECYVMSKAVKVLGITQQLAFHPYQRVLATAQMVQAVMTPGGLEPGAGGVLAALRVRLMHAAIRHLATQRARRRPLPALSGPRFAALQQFRWSPADGLPINQEDAAYTLLTFSIVILDALRELGARPSAEDQRAYLHCWNVIGDRMGVRADLLAHTPEEARELLGIIQARQLGRTAEGVLLTRAIQHAIGTALHSQRLSRFGTPIMTRWLLGAEKADLLSVPELGALQRLARPLLQGTLWLSETTLGLVAWIPPFGRLESAIGARLVAHLAALPPAWDESLFALPEDLRDARRPMPST